MKKKYVSPDTFIDDMELSTLMAYSLNSTASGDQNIIPDASEPSPDEFTSRRYNAWGDYEDDEF